MSQGAHTHTPSLASVGSRSGLASPRGDTPEPDSRQGRRNLGSVVQLLDDEGQISDKFEQCLNHVFSKYCTPAPPVTSPRQTRLLQAPSGAYLTEAGLDRWAQDTNGAPFAQDVKDELREFLDVTEEGHLTFKGFLQIYALQTENDEEETWRDLSNHGFDRNLNLVATRREELEMDEGESIPTESRSIPGLEQRMPVEGQAA